MSRAADSPPRVLMLFLDGVGIGRADSSVNPFFATPLPVLSGLFGGRLPHLSQRRMAGNAASLTPLNATLGVAGLPQSGTGQTTLFTGINAARYIGKHFGPYPYSTLRPIIAERNIFRTLIGRGKKALYANAYPRKYLDHLDVQKNRTTATVMAWLSTGFPLNGHEELRRGRALAADITNEHWVQLGFGEVPVISPREAGRRVISMLEEFNFVLYEYFYTDHAGHSRSMEQSTSVLRTLDEFVGGILDRIDHDRMTVLVTSDHGNIEDLSTKSHTRNPVPLILLGARRDRIASRVRDLTHVAPAVLDLLS